MVHDILEDKIKKYGMAYNPGMQEVNLWLHVLTIPADC